MGDEKIFQLLLVRPLDILELVKGDCDISFERGVFVIKGFEIAVMAFDDTEGGDGQEFRVQLLFDYLIGHQRGYEAMAGEGGAAAAGGADVALEE